MDRVKKLFKYRQAGVKEYWIVEPDEKILTVFRLDSGNYKVDSYDEGTVKVGIFEDLTSELSSVFTD